MNEGIILIHHGVKGMKWGVRKYKSYNRNAKRYDFVKTKISSDDARKMGYETAKHILSGSRQKANYYPIDQISRNLRKDYNEGLLSGLAFKKYFSLNAPLVKKVSKYENKILKDQEKTIKQYQNSEKVFADYYNRISALKGQNHVDAQKMLTLSVISKQKRIEAGEKYAEMMSKKAPIEHLYDK